MIRLLITLAVRSSELTPHPLYHIDPHDERNDLGFFIYEQVLMGFVDSWDTNANLISSDLPQGRQKVLDHVTHYY